MTSIGGVSLLRCFFAAGEAQADFWVACASRNVTPLLENTPVDTLVPFFPTIAAARDHFTVASKGERKPTGQRVGG
jgi:hypothetical protein